MLALAIGALAKTCRLAVHLVAGGIVWAVAGSAGGSRALAFCGFATTSAKEAAAFGQAYVIRRARCDGRNVILDGPRRGAFII